MVLSGLTGFDINIDATSGKTFFEYTSGFKGFDINIDATSGKTFFEYTSGFKGIELDLSFRDYIEPVFGFKGLYIEHIPTPLQNKVIRKKIIH